MQRKDRTPAEVKAAIKKAEDYNRRLEQEITQAVKQHCKPIDEPWSQRLIKRGEEMECMMPESAYLTNEQFRELLDCTLNTMGTREKVLKFFLQNIKNSQTGEEQNIMPKVKKTTAEVRADIAKTEKAIVQTEHYIKQLNNQNSKAVRKERTRRLIQRGAIAESFILEADYLTNEQFKTVLSMVINTPYAREIAERFIKQNAAETAN